MTFKRQRLSYPQILFIILLQTEAEMKMTNYLFDHSEIKELFSDYIKNILLLKPENVLPFTMDYFQSLCPIKLPRQCYFDSNDEEM